MPSVSKESISYRPVSCLVYCSSRNEVEEKFQTFLIEAVTEGVEKNCVRQRSRSLKLFEPHYGHGVMNVNYLVVIFIFFNGV